MLEGVVPFPAEFARRYRAKGYWQDKSLGEEFAVVFRTYASRVALVDGERSFTYQDIDRKSIERRTPSCRTGVPSSTCSGPVSCSCASAAGPRTCR